MIKLMTMTFSEKSKAEEECDSVTAILVGVETVQSFKKFGKVGCRQTEYNKLHNWRNVYGSWKFQVSYKFNFIVNRIEPYVEKTPRNILPNPTESDRYFLLTIFRFAHVFSSNFI